MEGMLSPEMKEEITGTAEIRETFKISKIGTIAGCMVISGKIYKDSGIRLIREGSSSLHWRAILIKKI
jgi:translation initiation factor IF-2